MQLIEHQILSCAENTSSPTLGPVTDQELWVAIGKALAAMRVRRGHDNTYALFKELKAKDRGAPAKNTLDAVEKGTASVEKIEAYGRAMGYTLVDLITSVLEAAGSTEPPLSPDARFVGRMFEHGPDDDLRKGMIGAARAQERALLATRESSREPSPGPPAQVAGSHGRPRTRRGTR